MTELKVLLLSDGRPGHYHLAEGVVAAIARRRPVKVVKLRITRHRQTPGRLLAWALMRQVPAPVILRLGYGLAVKSLPAAQLVVSAGGDSLAVNAATARYLAAKNIYCGTVKHLPPQAFSLVVSSYASHGALPNHIVTLKPSGIDPDTFGSSADNAPATGRQFGPGQPPKLAGLLVGGNSGLFKYTQGEWDAVLQFLINSRQTHGTRWIVSTSRRTDSALADKLAALAANQEGPIVDFIDFRRAGPGTLPDLFARAEVVLCSADSSTMVSEAICARRPVVGFMPAKHGFKPDEREYRTLMLKENWCRFLALADLTPDSFVGALGQIAPLRQNHLDRLADKLAERLPSIFQAS